MFSHQAAQLFMQQPKKDENVDDRGSNPASGSSPLFSLPPHSSAHLFAASHHHLQNSLFTSAVTSQQQADFLSAISSGQKKIANLKYSLH